MNLFYTLPSFVFTFRVFGVQPLLYLPCFSKSIYWYQIPDYDLLLAFCKYLLDDNVPAVAVQLLVSFCALLPSQFFSSGGSARNVSIIAQIRLSIQPRNEGVSFAYYSLTVWVPQKYNKKDNCNASCFCLPEKWKKIGVKNWLQKTNLLKANGS